MMYGSEYYWRDVAPSMTRLAESFREEYPDARMKWAICDTCEGEGKADNIAFSNGFESDDPDEYERYAEGFYDVVCEQCNGSGKVKTIDHEEWDDYVRDAYADAQAHLQELRMGA